MIGIPPRFSPFLTLLPLSIWLSFLGSFFFFVVQWRPDLRVSSSFMCRQRVLLPYPFLPKGLSFILVLLLRGVLVRFSFFFFHSFWILPPSNSFPVSVDREGRPSHGPFWTLWPPGLTSVYPLLCFFPRVVQGGIGGQTFFRPWFPVGLSHAPPQLVPAPPTPYP